MLSRTSPARVLAVLDLEMGAIGDPRPTWATCSRPTRRQRSGERSALAGDASPGSHAGELVERYADRSGRDLDELPWFEALACLGGSVVFCEAIYQRWLRGEMEGPQPLSRPALGQGVPALAARRRSASPSAWVREVAKARVADLWL